MSTTQPRDDAGIWVVVQKILEDRLDVKLPDETTGSVPVAELFAGGGDGKTMVLPPNLVYSHPLGIVIGQRIKVLPLDGRPGCYSRKKKVIWASESLSEGSIIPAGVTEITQHTIHAMSDEGVEFCLSRRETESELERLFGSRRLNPAGEAEDEWVYVHDRIKVRVGKVLLDAVRSAEMALREIALPADTEATEVHALEVPVAPSLALSSVLIIDSDLDSADVVQRFFQDASYKTDWMLSLEETSAWIERTGQQTAGDRDRYARNILAVVAMDAQEFDWEQVCSLLISHVPNLHILLTFGSDEAFLKGKSAVRARQVEFRIVGAWKKDGDLEALSALLFGQSELFLAMLAGPKDQERPKPHPATVTFDRAVAYSGLAEDCRLALDMLLEAAGEEAAPAAAILFEIHKKTHQVSLAAAAGNRSIIEEFRTRVRHLHKSPVRDLAIYRQKSDVADAKTQKNRYLYFLDTVGGPDSDLSVFGLRPNEPAGSPHAYAIFVLSPKCNAFSHAAGLTKSLQRLAVRTVETALVARSLQAEGLKLRREAERASDFQYMAHEATQNLSPSARLLENTTSVATLSEEAFQPLRSQVLRAHEVMKQFRPSGARQPEQFSPGRIIAQLFALCGQLETTSRLILEFLPREIPDVEGRALVFESVVRNLALNSIQQIKEYCSDIRSFSVRDIKDLAVLVARLRRRDDPVSTYLWEHHLSPSEQERLENPGVSRAEQQSLILGMLNRAIREEPLGDEPAFHEIALSEETRKLKQSLEPYPTQTRFSLINRLLLEDAFVGLLTKIIGQVRILLRVRDEADGRRNLLAYVIDDGPGIHTKYWQSVFTAGVSTRRLGTGLGLAISRRLLQDAGGSLTLVDSFIYGGSVFLLALPIKTT